MAPGAKKILDPEKLRRKLREMVQKLVKTGPEPGQKSAPTTPGVHPAGSAGKMRYSNQKTKWRGLEVKTPTDSLRR